MASPVAWKGNVKGMESGQTLRPVTSALFAHNSRRFSGIQSGSLLGKGKGLVDVDEHSFLGDTKLARYQPFTPQLHLSCLQGEK